MKSWNRSSIVIAMAWLLCPFCMGQTQKAVPNEKAEKNISEEFSRAGLKAIYAINSIRGLATGTDDERARGSASDRSRIDDALENAEIAVTTKEDKLAMADVRSFFKNVNGLNYFQNRFGQDSPGFSRAKQETCLQALKDLLKARVYLSTTAACGPRAK